MHLPVDPVGLRLQRYVGQELANASTGLAARGRGMRAGVHHARKSIRRARAALRLGWQVPPADVALALSELQLLNESLSDLRDTHVLVGVVDRLLLRADKEERGALKQARKALAARRRELEQDAGVHTRLVDIAAQLAFHRNGIDGLRWNDVATVAIDATLEHTEAQIARARSKAVADGEAEAWHRWRRRLRRLSQQHRACSDIGIELDDDLFAKSLAEQLGVLQDLNLLAAHGGRGLDLAKLLGTDVKHAVKQAAKRERDVQLARLSSVLASETDRPVSDVASDA
jgi:hypothetical protein